MKFRYRWIMAMFLILCILSALWLFLSINNKDAIIQDFPIYNKSENVQVNHVVQDYPWVRRIISFQTPDSSNDVLTYYRQLLLADGWRLVEDRDGVTVFINDRCPTASVEIIVDVIGKKTVAEITLAQQPCR